MKTTRFGLVLIAVLCFLLWSSNTALARTRVYVGVGYGYSDFRHGFYHHHGWGHHHPYWGPVIIGGGYWYDWGPDYYVVTPPMVVERAPVVVERQTVVVPPKGCDKDTQALFEDLRNKKNELLKKLQTPDKEQRKAAIDELAGFSYDDNVRQALENVLLSDPDPELRKEAARMFGEVKNVKALAALEKARVEDSNEDVRKEADKAIKKIDGAAS